MGSFSAEEYFTKVENMVFSSSHILRKLFEARWKEKTGEDWEHTEEQGQIFVECEEGKKVYKNANKDQKEMIRKGCLDAWDVSFLAVVLRNFGDQNLYEIDNDAVRQLSKLRNKQKHSPLGKLSRDEYNAKVDSFRELLGVLRVESSEIEKIIEKAGITSSEAARKAIKQLLEKGDKHLEVDEFENAIACFDEATTMPSLLPVHEGAVYEKRADCYLKQACYLKRNQQGNDGDKCVKQAMLDATLALELNDSSWNAQYLIGQCHRWNRCYDQAIQHYNRALALSPVQKHVKRELDSCKVLLGRRQTCDNVDPRNAPLTLGDMVAGFEDRTGLKLTEEEILRAATVSQGAMCEGQAHVFQGHKCFHGLSVPQDEDEAARYYKKAADVGNVEGIYNLGMCFAWGKGVPQNLKTAHKLYQQAANMKISGGASSNSMKTSVSQAQHALGLWCQNGIYVEQDYLEAVMWYEKAVENGCGKSAQNLGLMYADGEGVPMNEKMAEMYWNKALEFNDPNAAESLMHYYIRHLEPGTARAMFFTGKQMGSIGLSGVGEEEFNSLLQDRLSEFSDLKGLERDVVEHEAKHALDSKGMTFYERLQRKLFVKDSLIDRFLKNLEQKDCNDRFGGKLNSLTKSELDIIEKKALEGSKTAQTVWKSISTAVELSNFIMESEIESDNDRNYNLALNLFYECCTADFHVVKSYLYNPPVKAKLKTFVGQFFKSECRENGENDMKIRFCYVCYNSQLAEKSNQSSMIEILKQGLKMYPDNVHYFNLLSSLYELTGDSKSGLECCTKGLEKYPDNMDLLYWKAVHLHRLSELDTEKLRRCTKTKRTHKSKIAAYIDFLSKAPSDNRNVAYAFYGLTAIYMGDAVVGKVSGMRKVERYYNLGKESEMNMLPCYLPYVKSDFQQTVETFLSLVTQDARDDNCENSNSLFPSAPKGILERKQYLASPMRTQLIIQHRKKAVEVKKMMRKPDISLEPNTQEPKLTQTSPKRMTRLKPITLKQMNPTCDEIFENCVIDLTIIEDSFLGLPYLPSIPLVAEDENGDVTRLYIYNVEQNKEAGRNLAHGSTIGIMNPYMRIGSLDGANALRIDDPRCLVYLSRGEKMCRFCGEKNAAQKCSKCKKAWYRSKECQKLDWKLLKHKLICAA